MSQPKQQRLDIAVETIRQRFGETAIRRVEHTNQVEAIPHISTGFPALDHALTIGGFPKGQLSHLCGVPTSGATTLALKTLAQAVGQAVVYVTLSPTFDADYAARCGVMTDNVLLVTSETVAQAIEALLPLVDSAAAAVLVLPHPAPHAPSADVNRLVNAVRRSSCAVLVLTRDSAAPVARDAAVRLSLRRERWLHRRSDVNGYRIQAHILKNQFGLSGLKVPLVIGFSGTVAGDGT